MNLHARVGAVFTALVLMMGCGDNERLPGPPATPIARARFCDLPGSLRVTESARTVVPGGPAEDAAALEFLQLPVGFCAHVFARVGNPRQLRFAPAGELFVSSPGTPTTSNGPDGRASILVLPDDDRDGVADSQEPYLAQIPSNFGMTFANGFFYYQDATRIMRRPYRSGDRRAAEPSEVVADIRIYESEAHWPKALDVADDGTLYAGNGGDQGEDCEPGRPFHGGILKLDGAPGGTPVVAGMRNPISVRCARGHNRCFAVELGRDISARVGGREKLARIREGEDWGFPCCAGKDVPFPEFQPTPDCSTVTQEQGSFLIGNTPFDVDFESGRWPAPWTHRAFVPLHGTYVTWAGMDLVALEMDPLTGDLLPGSTMTGAAPGSLLLFASGWDDRTLTHGRPTAIAFAPDGRMFLSNDANGLILWIAPLDL